MLSILWVYYSKKHIENLNEDSFQSGKELEHIIRIGGFVLPYIIYFKIINSIGFIPYVVVGFWLIRYYLKRKQLVDKSQTMNKQ